MYLSQINAYGRCGRGRGGGSGAVIFATHCKISSTGTRRCVSTSTEHGCIEYGDSGGGGGSGSGSGSGGRSKTRGQTHVFLLVFLLNLFVVCRRWTLPPPKF